MYIDINDLFWMILGLVAAVALVYIIITLKNVIKLLNNVNEIIEDNKGNIKDLCEDLPKISENVVEISENTKDIVEVATDFTADAVIAKDNLTSNYETIKDILNIVISVFSKK